MAKATLPTNFKDDVMDSSMGGKRRYHLIQNSDDTVSLEDVTSYTQVGSSFGAAQVNATNQAVNESVDKAVVIDNLADISANTTSGKVAGALAVRELNRNYIIEVGSNSNGHYQKFANGTSEMWGNISLSSVAITTQNGGTYMSAGKTFALPATSLTPITGLSLEFRSNGGAWPAYSTSGDNKSTIGYWIRNGVSTTIPGVLHYHCFGTWK